MKAEIVPRPHRVGEKHLSEYSRETMAEYKAQGRLLKKSDYEQAAMLLNVSVEQIKKWDADDSVNQRAMLKFQPRAFQSLVKHWPKVEQAMMERKSWAFRIAAQIATVLPVGGIHFQQNTMIDARVSGQTDAAKEWAQNWWKRVRESRGEIVEVEDESESPAS